MKKTTSIVSLATAVSFWRIFVLLAALAATQLLTAWSLLKGSIGSLALEQILDHPVYRLSPTVAITLTTVALLVGYGGAHSRVNYTMSRLCLSSRRVAVIHMAYCVGVYLMFWMFQVAVAMATAALYRSTVSPLEVSQQLELLTCYRSVYLHPLLPLSDLPFWVTTPLIYAGLGVNTAMGVMRSMEGKFSLPPVVFSLLTALYTAQPGDYTWAVLLTFVLWAGVCVSAYQCAQAKQREVVT